MKPYETLARSFVENHPQEAARVLEQLDPAEAAHLLEKFSPRLVGLLMERLMPQRAGVVLERLEAARVKELISAMSPRQASLVLQHVETDKREETLSGLPSSTVCQLRELLSYPADTAGGMMEPRVSSIPVDVTVQAAAAIIRKAPRQTLFYLYVTDREGRLVGVLNMRNLMLASPKESIESIMSRETLSIPATMDRDEVISLMRRHRFLALPVVDAEGRLIGIVKHDEALRAGQLEAFEDIQKMVGAGGDEQALSTVSTVVKRRLPWLYVNLLTAFAAAAVVGVFEGVIQQVTALAVLLPIVSGQGGNTGAQALAVVMRGLALREILPGAVKRVIVKEVTAGLINGIAIAFATGAAVWVWSKSAILALVIGMAMVVNMVIAGFSGAAIPLTLRALKRDPAQSSSIFLTTVTDVVGFGAFLGFALIFLPLLLQ